MDHFFRILGDEINFDAVPLVLDCELDHGQSVSKITQTTADALAILHQRTGQIPWIYSRAGWVDQHLKVSALPLVYWWLAQYRYALPYPLYTPEYQSPPRLPKGVCTWQIHQTTSRGAGIGTPGAYFMDYNRYNGTKADLLGSLVQPVPQPITCPVDGLECPRIFR
jgi:GH25 family lysozyme M1 (1,4-beta-N-acetylmuramidase)